MDSIQAQMQVIIRKDLGNFDASVEELQIYRNTYGDDDFAGMINELIYDDFPIVSIICFEQDVEECNQFISNQFYVNYEQIIINSEDAFADVTDYIVNSDSEYVFVYEKGNKYFSNFLYLMIKGIKNSKTSVYSSLRNYCVDNQVIARADIAVLDTLIKSDYSGADIIRISKENNRNWYGTVGCSVFEKQLLLSENIDGNITDIGEWNSFFWNVLSKSRVSYSPEVIIDKIVDKADVEGNILEKSDKITADGNIEKKITFIATDKGEYYNLLPIAREAEKRGYDTQFTENLQEKAEIGVYCQHVCFPENSKFSVCLLHDMAQGHNRWPNLWELENWDKFDIGVLPGVFWGKLWKESSFMPYTRPRCGTYIFGYPKADAVVNNKKSEEEINAIKERFGFKYDKTILYAPSWENDEKEDDFIKALQSLKVNLLIKQAQWPKGIYDFVINNIETMRKEHEGKYDNLYYMEPEESIMDAIELCDLLVSDESSVMTEALLLNKPSIAVYDWMIPDKNPPRRASTPFNYVVKCKRVELREYVEKFLNNAPMYKEALEKGKEFYSNQGNTSSDIMDAIEYFCGLSTKDEFKKWELVSEYPSDYIMNH